MTDNNDKSSGGDELTLHLTLAGNQSAPRVPVKVSAEILPSDLREKVGEATRIPLASLRLIYRGRLIGDKDDAKGPAAAEFKLEDGSVLHCMGKPAQPPTVESNNGASAASGDQQQQASSTTTSAATAGSNVSVPPSASTAAPLFSPQVPAAAAAGDPLKAALQTLRSSNSPAEYKTAVTTLDKILTNIMNNPAEEKYRKVKKQNAAFQRRLGGLSGGDDAMTAAGFVTEQDDDSGGEQVYIMHANAEAWPKLTAAKDTVEAAVREASAPQPAAAAAAAPFPMMPSFGGAGAGAGGAGFPAAPTPEMQNAMAEMFSDPDALRSMMQNPMFQQAMRSDPRMANNPMMQQAMEQLANNPQAVNQLSQMMRDPNVMSRMRDPNMMRMMQDPNMMRMMQAMQQQQQAGGGGGLGGGMMPPSFGAAPPPAGGGGGTGQQQPNNAPNAQSGGSGGTGNDQGQQPSDQDMTEDEMIAEAIRRSLQDNS